MSCEVRVTTFNEVQEVRIECCNKIEIEQMENSIISSITQKLEKLNVLIKNCDVYSDGTSILLNDRYNICKDITEISTAFGFTIKQLDCSLKGKTYIINDDLIKALKQFGREYSFGKKVINKELSEEVKDILSEHSQNISIDKDILAMVNNIKKNGQFVTTKTREITDTTEDGYLVNRQEGEWKSNETSIRADLMELSKKYQGVVNKANEQLRDGTAKLIYSRARQMGYAVQEIKKGTQTQLVLVRCD